MNEELIEIIEDIVNILHNLGAGTNECQDLMTRLYNLINSGENNTMTLTNENMKITDQYSKDLANFIVSQIFTTQCNPSYLICHDISHKECNCKEIYGEVLSSEDGTLAKYLAKKIFEFIEQ